MVQELQTNQTEIIRALTFGLIFLVIVSSGIILFFHYSRRKIIQKEKEKALLKVKHQQKILQTSIAIQETERKRIAQDMHDAISSKLNVLSLTTNVLLGDKNLKGDQKKALKNILAVTTTTLESSRKIAHDLLPPTLEKFGLTAALEELFDSYGQSTGVDIEYSLEELQLTETNQLHVFRILQELINNSITHGKANELAIYFEKNKSGFLLRYQDNGEGFNTDEAMKSPGIGLQNIKSRVKILTGKISIDSNKNHGSTFVIQSSNA